MGSVLICRACTFHACVHHHHYTTIYSDLIIIKRVTYHRQYIVTFSTACIPLDCCLYKFAALIIIKRVKVSGPRIQTFCTEKDPHMEAS